MDSSARRGNRFDEIQCRALDIAQHVSSDPEIRQRVADDLIRLVGLMVEAVGKGVAVQGESDMGDPDDETGYARYRTGEDIVANAEYAVNASTTPGVDLERWSEGGLPTLWVSYEELE